MLFQRSQLTRTPQEQGVAAGVRQIYGDQVDQPGAKVLAEQLRLNASIRDTQMAYSSLAQMGSSLIDPLLDKTRSWGDAFSDLGRNIARAALQAALFGQGPFAGAFGTQGAGAGPGGVFGSLLSGAGLLGGSKSVAGALQGPTQSGATLDAVAGNGVFSAIGLGIKSLLGFADGGSIRGPVSGTSDSILARVSDGEFIVRASQAQRHRGLLEAINGPGLPGFATGGGVDLRGSILNRYANGGSVGMSAAERIFSPTPEVGEEMVCEVEVRIAA